MPRTPTAHLAALPPYVFSELERRKLAARARGHQFRDLGIGSPDMPIPPAIIEAIHRGATDTRLHGYPPFRGLSALLDSIATYMQRRFDVAIDPARETTVVAGSKEGIAMLLAGMCGPGDVVLAPSLSYPVYVRAPLMHGADVHFVPMDPARGWRLDLSSIPADILRRAKVLIANYPNNPTGATCSRDDLAALVEFARANDVLLMHDLAYAELAFDGHVPASVLEIPGAREVAVEFHSTSKMFNMAGMRCGFVVGNAAAVDIVLAYRANVGYGVSTPIQVGAAYALDHSAELVAPIAAEYRARRDALYAAFQRAGWQVTPPSASMYAWLPLPAGVEPWDAVQTLLDEGRVMMTPGLAFGVAGERWFRLSLVAPAVELASAAERIVATLPTPVSV
jgi:LL-diaminopimelate aminotransferase